MSEICERIHLIFNNLPRYQFPFDVEKIPRNGIYILYEEGEQAHGVDRIVRVGTHTGDDQLRSRLQQHFVQENKDRSIFRKNIGRALLRRAKDPFLDQWEWDLTSQRERERRGRLLDVEKQSDLEKAVSKYIRQYFSFVVFQVHDKVQRLALETKIISTISLCPQCGPSSKWLGLHSPKRRIRESGLWLVNGLYKEGLTPSDLETLLERVGKG